jgi:ABC-type branched-subunit amino acid transport system substrate-binding protein
VGIARIAVVHADDSFSQDGLAGTLDGLNTAKLKPVAVLMINRDKPDYASVVPGIVQADAQAVVWIGSGTAVTEAINTRDSKPRSESRKSAVPDSR